MQYILHANVITPHRLVEDGLVGIENGKIAILGVSKGASLPAGADVIDAAGLLVSPGWIDVQVNGAFGHDFTEDPSSIWEVAAKLPRFGTTGILPTIITSPMEKLENAFEIWRQGLPDGWRGATPLGLHLEGPFLNPIKKGAHNPVYLRQPDPVLIKNWLPENGVRMVTLAPELPGSMELVRLLVERGIAVSAGHSMSTFDQAWAGFEAGITACTHLFNAMPVLEHRAPGLVGASLTNDRVYAGFIPDGIHTHPAVISLAWKCKHPAHLMLVTDGMAALGMKPGNYCLGDFEVTVDETSARLADGTLAGSILTQEAAVRNLVKFTGCSLEEAVCTLSTTPAAYLKLSAKGKVQVGYDADLTLVNPDGRVEMTLVGGEVVFSRN